MTTIKRQVTCSLCNLKIEESKWNSHIVSTNHLEKCGKIHNELTTKFLKMIFGITPELERL